ncbi:hypothetical protein [Sediminimonas sp.]|uniref:hypothetical protein n=1 Tax=Sediminimonas sp. TaxID=2823379 RepID=UPI0025D3C114|nr:hypothetical protein [Sediminimonas sp.]
MLIRSKILREGGTKVVLDDTEYHFKPEADEPEAHICDVKNAAHRARLLSIKDGFCIHTQKTAEQKAEAKAAEKEAQDAEDAADADGLEVATRAQLDAEFKDLFDRKPNSRATNEAVIAKIREKRAENGAAPEPVPEPVPAAPKAKPAKGK